MSANVEHERAWIGKLYSGSGWKKKVAKMPDAQVLAIYLREKRKATADKKPQPNPRQEPDALF